MTTRQESKLSMYLAVQDFLATQTGIVSILPNYATITSDFNQAVDMIMVQGEKQGFNKSGIALNKKEWRAKLVSLAADSSRQLSAFAQLNQLTELLKEVNFSESSLKTCADTTLRDRAQGIYNRSQTHLAAYGITAATQTELQTAIDTFLITIPKPRLGALEKKQHTRLLAEAFAAADGALDKLDMVVEIVRLTQPDFYANYLGVRRIIKTGWGALALKGAIVKKSAEKGGFQLKGLTAGMYQIKASKSGYADYETRFAVTEGERSELKIELSKH